VHQALTERVLEAAAHHRVAVLHGPRGESCRLLVAQPGLDVLGLELREPQVTELWQDVTADANGVRRPCCAADSAE
jgi:hypothetical protein